MKARAKTACLYGWIVLLVVWLCGGCASQIGDSCRDNVDCSPVGERICDTAQPDGYCTVQGCNATSCPDEARCVAFYPAGFLSTPCDPRTEDAVDPSITATDDCLPDEHCLTGGLCARRALEQRFCMKPCEADGDCRSGYECSRTGIGGAEAIVEPKDVATRDDIKFCRQRPAI